MTMQGDPDPAQAGPDNQQTAPQGQPPIQGGNVNNNNVLVTLVGALIIGVLAMAAVTLWGPISSWGFGGGNSVKAELVQVVKDLENPSADDIKDAIRGAVTKKVITREQADSLQSAIERAVKNGATFTQIKETADDAAFDGLSFDELIADIRDLKAPKGTTPTAPAVSGGTTTQQPTQPSGTGSSWVGGAGTAPQTIEEASRVLGVDKQFLTKLNARPGDDFVIGWVIGTNGTELAGMRIQASHIPQGTCVDLDPNASKITNQVVHSQRFLTSSRTLTGSDGAFDGLKASVYWTPCEFTDGFKPQANAAQTPAATNQQALTVQPATQGASQSPAQTQQPASQPSVPSGCPTKPSEAATLMGGNEANWREHAGSNKTGWEYGYNGVAPSVTLKTPTFGRIDGQVANTTKATFWCNG